MKYIHRIGMLFICLFVILSLAGCKKWHVEKYILEGDGYSLVYEYGKEPEKHYYVAGEEIRLGIYPQTTEYLSKGIIFSYKTTGPYKIRVHFSPGHHGEDKKILIHSVELRSNLGSHHFLEEAEKFPITVGTEPFYHTTDIEGLKKRNLKYKTSYNHLFEKAAPFDFSKGEEIEAVFNVEVIKGMRSMRESVTLKIVPHLDEGYKIFYFDGV
jgi:hypothetical protein